MGTDLKSQIDAFVAAPLLYLGALVAVGLIIWGMSKFLYGHRIEGLKEELDRERRENARLREEIGTPRSVETQSAADDQAVKAATTEIDQPPRSVTKQIDAIETDGHKDRVFLRPNINPKFLRQIYRTETEHQAHQAIKPYIGKWMIIEGTVKDVSPRGSDWTLRLEDGGGIRHTAISFEESEKPKLEILRKGDMVRVEGCLASANALWVDLKRGKLLDSPSQD